MQIEQILMCVHICVCMCVCARVSECGWIGWQAGVCVSLFLSACFPNTFHLQINHLQQRKQSNSNDNNSNDTGDGNSAPRCVYESEKHEVRRKIFEINTQNKYVHCIEVKIIAIRPFLFIHTGVCLFWELYCLLGVLLFSCAWNGVLVQ